MRRRRPVPAAGSDHVAGPDELEREIETLVALFSADTRVRRLFIDEITAVAGWQKAVKRLADSGTLRQVLLITTGSKASDIQREAELLPGRKGKLARTIYLFAQLPYKVFHAKASPKLGSQTLAAYLIAGGSPPSERFRGRNVRGITLEDFLLDEET